MIDAWDIYWVLQLDSINCVLGISAMVAAFFSGITIFLGFEYSKENPDSWNGMAYKAEAQKKLERSAGLLSLGKRTLFLVAMPLIAAFALTPSTKTAAAMIVVPAIANNEAIQREAGDLYDLAKQALAEAVKPDKSKPAE